jgi:transaldolase/glucose-6-phosphate isomerase
MNRAKEIFEQGQSIWFDNIDRDMLRDGRMRKMVEDGQIYGVTSNPSIFEAALKNSVSYDDVLQAMAWSGMDRGQIYFELVKDDIQRAAGYFTDLYESSNGQDGLVSVEIDPFYAYDVERSVEEGKSLWTQFNRPNLMIKVPATLEGLETITELIASGINVNATLIFSIERYRQVMDAYLSGLEKRLEKGEAIDHIASVASFFVSRIDTAIDQILDAVMASPSSLAEQAAGLKGKIAVDNAKLAYQAFKEVFTSERFKALQEKGANLQRPLWASTGTKNKAYSPTLYVDNLIAPHSVNTVPPATLEAYLNNGVSHLTIEDGLEEAHERMELLNTMEIDFGAVTQKLEDDGVEKFKQAHAALLDIIEIKRSSYLKELDGLVYEVQTALKNAAKEACVSRMYAADPSFWTLDSSTHEETRNRLGWLDLPSKQLELVPELEAFRDEVLEAGFTDAFVLGMGGSSLAPEVLSQIIGPEVEPGKGLRLQIIDTTNPDEIAFRVKDLDLKKTIFIVSSKSGGTSETMSALKYFWKELENQGVENVGAHFVAVTDPDTSLQALAVEKGFRRYFNAPANVGGRYSIFTQFGLVPAALIGVDLKRFLSYAIESQRQGIETVPYSANPQLLLGILMGEAAKAGRDKLTFIAESYMTSIVPWLEQLIAESSGKEGVGILPIEGEPQLTNGAYPQDRAFVYYAVDGSKSELANSLKEAGYPLIEFKVNDRYELGKEFYRWEYATAIACAWLGVSAFDQPNVQLSKTITKDRITEFQEKGYLDDGQAYLDTAEFTLYGDPVDGLSESSSLEEVLEAYAATVPEKGYIALNAFLPRLKEYENFLQDLRGKLLNKFNKATTLGFGPRFLHSTGQLHKGGQDGGFFITFTKDYDTDFDIPGEGMSFGTLQRAQALGDIEALKQKERRVIRVHLK